MIGVNVLLSGRLKLDGFGQGKPTSDDGTYQLALEDDSTVAEVIHGLGVPANRVALTMVNARQCRADARLKRGDRVILIPPDVAALWRFLGTQNLGMESIFDF